jgi:glycosyltransferase involved in cell wall biosynthesis
MSADALEASPASAHHEARRHPFGWSVIAYAASELGVGEAGRRVASAVRHAGVPTELVAVPTPNLSRQEHRPRQQVRNRIGYENAITCVNADLLPALDRDMGLGHLHGTRIGVWFWELEVFPERLHRAFTFVDEVWVASEFIRAAVQPATDKPVRTIALPMSPPSAPTGFTRRSLGLPEDRYLFLTNFDYLSRYARKNPTGAVRAYRETFSPDDGACLVVKSINGHQRPEDVERVRSEAQGRPDIVFLDHYTSSAGMTAMIELADTYVSLHRSEGYGINLADAMAHRTPVVATGYSGNMDFMDSSCAELVGHDLVEVGPGSAPYDAEALWADPRLDEASTAMRRLFEDRAHGEALVERALQRVGELSAARAGRRVRDLLLPELARTEVDRA